MLSMFQLHNALRQGAIGGFAGYGAATIFNSNPTLAGKMGCIHHFVQSIFTALLFKYGSYKNISHKANMINLAIDIVFIIAARSFNLIGDKGTTAFAGITLLRFTIVYYSFPRE